MKSYLVGLVGLAAVACAKPEPSPTTVVPTAPAPTSAPSAMAATASVTATVASTAAAPTSTEIPMQPAPTDKNRPFVRAVKWLCIEEEVSCEQKPTIAYDGLPAVAADGSVAFVEERDGWGHVKAPGLRVISSDGKERFLPSVTGDATPTFAAFQAKRAAHEAVIRDANTFLDNGHFKPLFPLTEVQTDAGVSKTRKFAAAGVVVSFNYPSAEKEGAFQELVIVQDGKEVARKKGTAFPDQKGCSARALKVDGARPESKVFAFSFVNGATLHNCDGKAEPQVHHVVRW